MNTLDIMLQHLLKRGQLKSVNFSTSMPVQAAGAAGYINGTLSMSKEPLYMRVETPQISVSNGAQFHVINLSKTGWFINYFFPQKTMENIELDMTIYYLD